MKRPGFDAHLVVVIAMLADQPDRLGLCVLVVLARHRAILPSEKVVHEPGTVHYYLGILGGKKVIVAMTGIGMQNATATTETALSHFTRESGTLIDSVVFAAVAGGSGRTEIGDVAVLARWTDDDGATWHAVDPGMLAAANTLTVDLESSDTDRGPQIHVGGDGSSDDNNNGTAFPAIPLGGAVFGPQPLSAPDYSPLFTGNFFRALGPFLARGVVSNITGFLKATSTPVVAVDQETVAAQQVADAHGVPFIGIRGMSDGPGDPLNLPGYPSPSTNRSPRTTPPSSPKRSSKPGIGSRARRLYFPHCRRQTGPATAEGATPMNTIRQKSVTAAIGAMAAGAAASALLFLGAGTSHASEFDPQPDPPGQARGFNPHPEPPTRHADAFNPPPGFKVGIAKY